MATIAYTTTNAGGNSITYTWANMANGDVGQALVLAYADDGAPDRTVQFFGTPGAGGTIIFTGACNPVSPTYFTLHDSAHNLISKTAAGGELITESTPIVRPEVTAGDGTTSWTCELVVRSST